MHKTLYILLDIGEFQFAQNEYLIGPNTSNVQVLVRRLHDYNGDVDVKWNLQHHSLSIGEGSLYFADNEIRKVINIDLQNIDQKNILELSLHSPSNGYQLGKNKVTNITFVSK